MVEGSKDVPGTTKMECLRFLAGFTSSPELQWICMLIRDEMQSPSSAIGSQ